MWKPDKHFLKITAQARKYVEDNFVIPADLELNLKIAEEEQWKYQKLWYDYIDNKYKTAKEYLVLRNASDEYINMLNAILKVNSIKSKIYDLKNKMEYDYIIRSQQVARAKEKWKENRKKHESL